MYTRATFVKAQRASSYQKLHVSLRKSTQGKVARTLSGVVGCADSLRLPQSGIVNLELPEVFRKLPHLLLGQLQW